MTRSDSRRCHTAALQGTARSFGFAAVSVGEVLHRRFGDQSAVGLLPDLCGDQAVEEVEVDSEATRNYRMTAYCAGASALVRSSSRKRGMANRGRPTEQGLRLRAG